MEINRVIENIRALTNKTVANGCTEAEAIAAAMKIGELLKVYNLSMDKVFIGNAKCITGSIDTGQRRRHPVDGCVVAIAGFCDCRVWFGHTLDNSIYNFFGLETDVEMAKYLYTVIRSAILAETGRYKRSDAYINTQYHRKRLSVSFQKGMAHRISARLNEMKKTRHEEEEQESMVIHPMLAMTPGTSLVLVKRKKVDDEFEQLNLGLRRAACNHHAGLNSDAYYDGVAAGDKVNLNRPINGQPAGYLN